VSPANTAVMGQATQPLPAPATTMPAPTLPAPTLPDQPRSSRGWWIAGGVTALALVVIFAIATITGDRPATKSASTPNLEPANPPSSASPTRSAEPSRAPAPRSSASETMKTPRTPTANIQGSLSDLRAAVAAVSSSGQIEARRPRNSASALMSWPSISPRSAARRRGSTSMIWRSTCANCQIKGN
jgi:hypothetical protein